MALTAAQIQARLDLYLAAETKILKGQEYTIGDGSTGRKLRRADLAEVRAEIRQLSADLGAAQARETRGRRVLYIR